MQAAIGSAVGARYRELSALCAKGDRQATFRVDTLVEVRLNRLLAQAAERVPFYRDRVVRTKSLRLDDFPVLTKSDIHGSFKDLMSPDLSARYSERRAGYSWVEVSSGGSTGQP